MSTETTANYTAVPPEKGRTAAAAARVEQAQAGPLRARPRAGARGRMVAATTATVERGVEKEREEGRPPAWEAIPPSIPELVEEARTGPEDAEEWHPVRVAGWRLCAWLAVLAATTFYSLLWVLRRPRRWSVLVGVIVAAWMLATAGTDTPPAPAPPPTTAVGAGVSTTGGVT